MQRAQNGDRVTVHYIGTLDNGRIFDQRDSDQSFTFMTEKDDPVVLALFACGLELRVIGTRCNIGHIQRTENQRNGNWLSA